MKQEWFLIQHGQHEGPYSEEEILDLIDSGQASSQDPCFHIERQHLTKTVGEVFQSIPRENSRGAAEIHDPPATEREASPPPPDPADQDSLTSTGRIIYRSYPSFLSYLKILACGFIFIISAYLVAPYVGNWILLASLLVLLLLLFYVLIDRSTNLYLVTDRRIEVISGLVSKSSKEVRIEDIRAINVNKRGLLGLLGVGTVEFASAGTDEVDVAFRNVRGTGRLKKQVRQLQDTR